MTDDRSKFPKSVAWAAFLIYAVTLAHGVTPGSLLLTAKVAGWDWLPLANRPLTWLLTLPLHLLPAGWIPVALNLFSAALAALTLRVLARSVELLPWSSVPAEKFFWVRKFPGLLAVAVCGFEFYFWQEATAMSGELLDLLLLATAVCCLLEQRVDAKEGVWLGRAAFVWGLGMTENWVMLVTLPLFVAALIALRGLDFFRADFIRRMTVRGLAGFSIYLLLPLVNGLWPHSPWSFGEAWLETFQSTKSVFHTLYYNFWSWHRLLTVLVLMYFLVPSLPCFLKLPDEDLENKPFVDRLQARIFLAARVALLLACLWLAFDPVVGPREIMRQQLGVSLPLLTFAYVNALGIAFLAGGLLFAAKVPTQRIPHSAVQKVNSFFRRNAFGLLGGAAAAVVLALLVRNLPVIVTQHRQPLEQFGETVARSLPSGGGIVLGNDEVKLSLLRAALAQRADKNSWPTVNLKLILNGKYRLGLERISPRGWLAAGAGELNPAEAIRLLEGMARTNQFYFLQPHNGQLVHELFQPQPLGAVSALRRYPSNRFERLVLPPATVAAGEKFWDMEWSGQIAALVPNEDRTSKLENFFKNHLLLVPARSQAQPQLAAWYSALLDDWGVTLARTGHEAAAQKRFAQAVQLNTNNLIAQVNLVCNSNRLAGKFLSIADGSVLVQKFRSIQQIAQIINVGGDVDEPALRCVVGNACLAAGWPRQAWAEFDRAATLAPEAVMPELALAQIYSRLRFDDEVFAVTKKLRAKVEATPAGKALEVELAVLEAKSWMSQTNTALAEKVLSAVLSNHPDDVPVAETVFRSYLAFGDSAGALRMIEAQLAKNPGSVPALNNQAALLIQSGRAAAAIPVLNRALALTNVPSILLNRAIAQMQLRNIDAAEKDYRQLTNAPVDQFSVHYGLSQIAEQRQETNAVIRHLEFCLTNAPTGGAKWQEVSARLNALGKTKAD